ncbi:MAG: hypothetical protein JO028_16565 [Acidobacteriaceae bacterium]|nr:hypothetical protein [Acidobacteriaceae bacterium]
MTKQFIGKKPSTTVSLTGKGCQALTDYWRTMDQIRKHAKLARNGK